MDQLIVDLDKVLDDFEEDEEKAAALVPGQEPKPSGFAQYLKTHEESPWESLSHESVPNMISQKDSIDELSEKPGVIAYDMPYHVPHEFDMSEANFSLSLNKGQTSSQNVNQVVVKTESDLNYQNSLNAKYVSINDRIEEYECDNTGNKVIGQSSNNPDILEIPESKPYQETKPPGSLTFVPLELVEPTTANSLPCANLLNSIDITPTEISGDLNTCNAGKDNLQINKLESCEEDNCNEEVELSREILANGTEMDDVSFCKELTDRNTQLFKSSSHSWSPDSEQVVPSQLADNSLEISAGEITNDNVESVMQRSGGLETMNNTVSEEKTKQNSLQISERKNCNIIENLHANLLPDSTCINEDNDLAQVSSPDSAANHEKHKVVVGFSDVSDCIDEDLINDYLADDEIIGANLNVMNNGCNSELRCVEPHTVKYVQEEILEITQHTTKGTVANTQDESVNLPNGDLSENGEEEVIDAPTAEQKIGDDLDFADKVEQSALNNCPFTGNVGFSCELASDSDLPNQIYENTHCSQDSSAVFENGTDNSSPDSQQSTILGARPKELSQMKKNRPNSLLGLSKISLDTPFNSDITKVTIHGDTVASLQNGLPNSDPDSKQRVQQCLSPLQKKLINMEIKQRLEKEHKSEQYEETSSAAQESSTLNSIDSGTDDDTQTSNSEDSLVLRKKLENNQPMQSPIPVLQTQVSDSLVTSPSPARPHSWSPAGVGPSATQKQKRPTSLNLPPRQELNQQPDQLSPQTFPSDSDSLVESGWMQPGECETTGLDATQEVAPSTTHPAPTETSPQPLVLNQLGKIAPVWVPDSDAPNCMQCEARFTFTKRRHHCRACGKVFCSTCCSMKNKLQYMDNKEARVCLACHQLLNMAETSSRAGLSGRSPNPNNPSEYCSTIPPLQQANAHVPLPTVMVPVGVLKREGSQRKGEPKQVMFSDGIRPGGDLTEGDGPAESRLPPRRTGRVQKKVEKIPQGNDQSSSHRTRCLRSSDSPRNKCLIPETGLPPIVLSTGVKGDFAIEEDPDIEQILPKIKTEENDPVIFAINSNLFVMVKIIHLDCCVSRVSWCFTTKGLCTVGQEEIVIVLEYLEEEKNIPKDIFWHFHTVYDEAYKGNTVSDMGHTIFNQSFLGSRDHGGFLYIRPSFQCLQKLLLPSPPYLFGILLQKWEAPWAKVFPIRLLLRLGAEYRYYPCPLISVRNRKPVFFEIGHTIMNLLADFRNYQYMLPQIRGVTIHMEDKRTVINFPRNRYDDLMKVVNNSNEHVMALGAKFSPDADSHLVCIQNDDGNYQTQAINIQNKPRKVTGASFVVFNGALKTSSGLTAKSSIVEDGLMVQIMPESMAALKQAMKDMRNYTIGCGTVSTAKPEEVVLVQWVGDDKSVNIGVRSPVDKMSMDGVKSVHIHNSPDYVGDNHAVRWTEVFFIQNEDLNSSKLEPVDLSRLAETLAQACCIALTPHLDQLKEAALTKVGLRVTIEAERVGYEVGASGEKLPDFYMNDLDNELIPVIHNAASQSQDGPIILELIFYVLD